MKSNSNVRAKKEGETTTSKYSYIFHGTIQKQTNKQTKTNKHEFIGLVVEASVMSNLCTFQLYYNYALFVYDANVVYECVVVVTMP